MASLQCSASCRNEGKELDPLVMKSCGERDRRTARNHCPETFRRRREFKYGLRKISESEHCAAEGLPENASSETGVSEMYTLLLGLYYKGHLKRGFVSRILLYTASGL